MCKLCGLYFNNYKALKHQMEHAGLLLYGSHISSSSIMCCYVLDMDYGHIHFVDGAGGGYTRLQRSLKGKRVQGIKFSQTFDSA